MDFIQQQVPGLVLNAVDARRLAVVEPDYNQALDSDNMMVACSLTLKEIRWR